MAGRKAGAVTESKRAALLEACKKAYKKHVLQDQGIGWDELSSVLGEALAFSMGDRNFSRWLDRAGKERPIV